MATVMFPSPSIPLPSEVRLCNKLECVLQSHQGFPAAWLLPYDDQVITKAQWNHEEPPAGAPCGADFSVNWLRSGLFVLSSRGNSIGLTIVRHYFGLVGCIIPIASIPTIGESTIIFTIAGPADAEGKKQFYVYFHDSLDLSATKIYRLRPFASVVDFFLNSHAEPWGQVPRVPPVPGGEDMVKQELNKIGFSYDDPSKNAIDWGDYWAAGLVSQG